MSSNSLADFSINSGSVIIEHLSEISLVSKFPETIANKYEGIGIV